jgi:hypothetical protein
MVDVHGIRQWSVDDARHMMQAAGFTEVDMRPLQAWHLGLLLVRGVKPAAPQPERSTGQGST